MKVFVVTERTQWFGSKVVFIGTSRSMAVAKIKKHYKPLATELESLDKYGKFDNLDYSIELTELETNKVYDTSNMEIHP